MRCMFCAPTGAFPALSNVTLLLRQSDFVAIVGKSAAANPATYVNFTMTTSREGTVRSRLVASPQ